MDATGAFRFERFASMPAFNSVPEDPSVRLAQRLAASRQTTRVAIDTEAGMFQHADRKSVV